MENLKVKISIQMMTCPLVCAEKTEITGMNPNRDTQWNKLALNLSSIKS